MVEWHDSFEALDGFEGGCWFPSSEGYGNVANSLADANFDVTGRRPALLLQPAGVADIQRAVQAAAAARSAGQLGDVPLTIRGGGHSELCALSGAIALDLRRLDTVRVDAEKRLVRIGGGARLGDVAVAAAAHGLAMPGGLHPTVGIGSVLQGGIGHLTRMCGLTVDNIVAVEFVGADSEVCRVEEGNAEPRSTDLLWAFRGAGPNFGVATEVTVRLYEVGPALHSRITRRGSELTAAAKYLAGIESVARRLGPDQSCDMALCRGPGESFTTTIYPTSISGREFSEEDAAAFGISSAAPAKLCAFGDLPVGGKEDEEGSMQSSPCMHSYVRQCCVDMLSTDGFTALLSALRALPDAETAFSEIGLQHAGGLCREGGAAGPGGSCFGNRSWEFSVVILALWHGECSETAARHRQWADFVFEAMAPFTTGLYAVDIIPHRRPKSFRSEVQSAFQDNLGRLRELKRKYDPESLFCGTYSLFDAVV